MTAGRASAVIAASAAVLLAAASVAQAAFALTFNRALAPVGALVTATQPGIPGGGKGVVVYLVPTRLPGVRPDSSGAYILRRVPSQHVYRLGTLHLTANRELAIHFRIPHVPPGDYTTAFWCPTCLKGGDFFASAAWGATSTGEPGSVTR